LEIINAIIDGNNTYVDLTNFTLLYVLADKYNPVYINQSPGFLNSEVSQKVFIQDIERNNVKYALTFRDNVGGDSISSSMRHHLVYRYLNKNFSPTYRTTKFDVWVKNDYLKNEKINEKNILLGNKLIDNFDNKFNNLGIGMNYLPYIIGKKYPNEGLELIQESSLGVSSEFIPNFRIEKEYSYYISINARKTQNINSHPRIHMYLITKNKNYPKFNEEYLMTEYNFTVYNSDLNPYSIPISTDYNWYSGYLDKLIFVYDSNIVKIDSIKIFRSNDEAKY